MAGTRKHIAVFMYGYDPFGSGVQQRTLTLVGAFAERGHRVDVVAVRAGAALRAGMPASVRLVELHAWAARVAPLIELWRVMTYGSVFALARYLRRERPDVMLSAATHVNLAAVCGRRLARIDTPLVLRASNNPPPTLLSRSTHRLSGSATAIIAVSDGVAAAVAAAGVPRERITTIYNPIVTPELLQRIDAPLDHPWFVPGAPPVLLGVGRLMPQKDFPTLLRAFARVRAARPARLLILGEGDPAPLTALAAQLGVGGDVMLGGVVPNPLPYMARAAVFVLSSRWEGLPGVLIEALACGCPVVSTDCPSGPAEILERGRYGPLVAVGDDAALAEAVLRVLDVPPDRDPLRTRAATFSADVAADRYLEVLLRAARSA